MCGQPCEVRAKLLCALCDTLCDTLRLLREYRFTPAERQAALWSAAGTHHAMLARVHSRANLLP
eukprot:8496551-Lingulodinium_polyedra.AAC.1